MDSDKKLDLIIEQGKLERKNHEVILARQARERAECRALAHKLAEIKEKDNCLRVRMLDRIADVMLSVAKWIEKLSEKVRNYNAHTTVVCDIKLAPRVEKIDWSAGTYPITIPIMFNEPVDKRNRILSKIIGK